MGPEGLLTSRSGRRPSLGKVKRLKRERSGARGAHESLKVIVGAVSTALSEAGGIVCDWGAGLVVWGVERGSISPLTWDVH